jgi:hypothetical protein
MIERRWHHEQATPGRRRGNRHLSHRSFSRAPAGKSVGGLDDQGTFLAAVGAAPACELLGRKDLRTSEFPPVETSMTDDDVAFRQHSAGHVLTKA